MTDKIYHVTAAANHGGILKSGIEPMLSRGKRKTSWYVSWSRLSWALAHCSARHNIPVSQLEVWAVDFASAKHLEKTHWPGLFQTECNHRTERVFSAAYALDALLNGEQF